MKPETGYDICGFVEIGLPARIFSYEKQSPERPMQDLTRPTIAEAYLPVRESLDKREDFEEYKLPFYLTTSHLS
jgi:hypothetical protein